MRVDRKYIYYFMKGLNYFQLLIPIATFLFVCIITYKTLIYKNTVDSYEKMFIKIENKDDTTVDFKYDNELIGEDFKNIEVNEYINCLNKKLTTEDLNNEIKLTIKTLQDLFNSSYNNFAFKYTDIYTGFTLSYNEKQEIFTASTIKAPVSIYAYQQAEKGLVNLDEKLTYTSNYYIGGTGWLKDRPFNEQYTIRELISYAIIPSDNIAHNMLMSKFGRENMYNYWNEKGTQSIFRQSTNWGVINANDATIYMKELYDYYNTDTELANELINNFLNVQFKPISGKDKTIKTANKSGWTGSVFHDVAIVFDDNPYILAVLSNTGTSGYTYLFNLTSDLVGQLHEQYWNLKYKMCEKIIK